MNKTILGLLALTSLVSVANADKYDGYLNLKSDLKVESEFNKNSASSINAADSGASDSANKLNLVRNFENKFDLGLYANERHEIFVFGGAKGLNLKVTGGLKDATIDSDAFKPSYYFGARWDAEIVDGFSTALTFMHKHGYSSEKKLLSETSVLGSETQKQKDSTGVTKNVHDGNVFQDLVKKHLMKKSLWDASKDNDDDREEYYKENGYFVEDTNDVDAATKTSLLSAILRGKIDRFNIVVGGIYTSKDFADGSHQLVSFGKFKGMANDKVEVSGKLEHKIDSKSYDNYGSLYADAKVSTTFDKFVLNNKLVGELKNITKTNNNDGHEVVLKSLNDSKYTGIDKLELVTALNYEVTLNTKTNATDRLVHKPKVKLEATIKPTDYLTLTSKNEDEVTLKQGTDYVLKDVSNDFKTKNEIKFAINDASYVKLLANYKLTKDFLTNKSTSTTPLKHDLVAGLGLAYKQGMLSTALDFRYHTDATKAKHDFYAWTMNKLTVSSESNMFELGLDAYVQAQNNLGTGTDLAFTNSRILFLVEGGAKLVNKAGKFTNTADLKASYVGDKSATELKHQVLTSLNLESAYKPLENVELSLGLKTTYNLNKLAEAYTKALKYRVTKDDKYDKALNELLNESEEHSLLDSRSKVTKEVTSLSTAADFAHELKFEPKLGAKLTYLEGNLEVKPYVGADVLLSANKKTKTDKKFALEKVVGKLGLELNYTW